MTAPRGGQNITPNGLSPIITQAHAPNDLRPRLAHPLAQLLSMDVFQFRKLADSGPQHGVLTIGNFDGVHRGHQALIRQVVQEAREMGAKSALMTFHPHPQSVLRPEPPPMLTSLALRLRLFESLGLDVAYVIPFTRELAALSPEAFVEAYLLSYFQVRKLIIGFDFHFGRNRAGSAESLTRLSAQHGFAFEVYPEYAVDGDKVSSSRVREALAAADFATAERLLGRPFSVLEPVLAGDKRGRQLGFPTLNQVPEERLALPFGVYASRAEVRGRWYDAVSNYGVRPTVRPTVRPAVRPTGDYTGNASLGAERPTLETFLFDFTGDLYGESVEVLPLRLLRSEQRFPSLEALKTQIAADCAAAQAYLATLPVPSAP